MREIQFRGKRTDNGEWVYGYYVVLIEGIRRNHCIIVENDECTGLLDERQTRYYVNSETVGQFVGLQDINGVNIFEGDLIKHDDGRIEACEYDKSNISFQTGSNLYVLDQESGVFPEFMEVVGNIYDDNKK